MRHLKIYLLLSITLPLFISCDPCRNLDCAANNYFGQFRIVNANDNKDLVFGPNKIYDKNQIRFYSLKGADTTFYEYLAFAPGMGNDSLLQVRFFPKADTAFVRLSSNDTDTLTITYKTTNSRCCGTITEISNFRFNNTALVRGDKGVLEIKK